MDHKEFMWYRDRYLMQSSLSDDEKLEMDMGAAAILNAIKRDFDADTVTMEYVEPNATVGGVGTWMIITRLMRIPVLVGAVMWAAAYPDQADYVAGTLLQLLERKYGIGEKCPKCAGVGLKADLLFCCQECRHVWQVKG